MDRPFTIKPVRMAIFSTFSTVFSKYKVTDVMKLTSYPTFISNIIIDNSHVTYRRGEQNGVCYSL